MNASQQTATSLLKDLGSSNLKARDLAGIFGQAKGQFQDKSLFVFIQNKAEWGLKEATNCGTNWGDARYPYGTVQFLLPSASDTPAGEKPPALKDYTHFLLVSGDYRRAILCPTHVIEAAPKGWSREGDGHRQVANVANWTKKLTFFVLAGERWIKDQNNIWTEPQHVPMDVDEFLESI